MDNQSIDLRNLLLMIKEQKQMDAELALEFDCTIETADVTPLVKVINYCINYVQQLSEQSLHISLNATRSSITISFTAFSDVTELPEISARVNEALAPYNAVLEQQGQPGKYVQLLISFKK